MKTFFKLIKFIYLIIKIKLYYNEKKIEKNVKIIIENMGPVFIKLAQILSVRTDLFSNNLIKELEKLQTHSKCIHFSQIKNIINNFDSLYKNIKRINENALASASIAQIHTGVLKNNKRIVIKILKPKIKYLINKDLMILYTCSRLINFFFKKFKRLKLIDITDEIKSSFDKETNFYKELDNMSEIKKSLSACNNIYIPHVIEDFTRDNILVMEYVDGININNKKKIIKEKINIRVIIKNLLSLFYKQVFEYKVFHADLHPGNILISKTRLMEPIIILIDFGITSNLTDDEKFYLGENILAFAKKDYKKIIHLHIKAKTIKITKSISDIEKELHDTFYPISNKKIKDINFKKLMLLLINLSKNLNMQLQPNLILFQKTLITIEALCRNLDENTNLWHITRNIMEKIILNKIIDFKFLNDIKIEEKSAKCIHNNTSFLNKIKAYTFSNFLFFVLIIYILFSSNLNMIIKHYNLIIFLI